MKRYLHHRLILAAVVAVGVASWSDRVSADDSVEVAELKAANEILQQQLAAESARADAIENQRLKLIDSFAESIRVSEDQVARAREIELKMQAFGVDLLAKDEKGIEQRLLKAVRDLDISQQELEGANAQIRSLTEAFLAYLAATPKVDAAKRGAAQAALDRANQFMAGPAEPTEGAGGELNAAKVVSIEPDIGLIVFNAGRRAGLRVGTPLSIHRGDQSIYSAMVIDVRDSISGAVLQDRLVESETVAVGDSVKLLPNQPNL